MLPFCVSRFASWVEGDRHFTESELSLYEQDPLTLNLSDDDEEDEISFHLNASQM